MSTENNNETCTRESHKKSQTPGLLSVTSGEIAQSKAREYAVTASYVAETPKCWLTALHEKIDRHERNAVQRDARLEAKLDNMKYAAINSIAFEAYKDGQNPTLHALKKENAGVGIPLCQGGDLEGPPTTPSVFGKKGTFFPRTVRAFHRLDRIQISKLSVWYNDDFGIYVPDLVCVFKEKFELWIACGGLPAW